MASANDQDPPHPAPDPDEDDLDDLDEILDDFSATKISSPPTSTSTSDPTATGPGRPDTVAPSSTLPKEPAAPASAEDDFARQLQSGMAEMLQELEANPDMAKQFEQMVQGLGPLPGMPSESTTNTTIQDVPTPAQPASSNTADDSFQDTIRRTMDRMAASSSSAEQAAKNPAEDDMMAQLLNSLGAAGGEGGDDDGFSKMLLGMMEQLTNKDVLYEPMKELDSKFPAWMEERTTGAKKGTLSDEDRKRYDEQRLNVREIVERFDKPGYKDENPEDREYIVERMQKMQAAGAPPPELVGDMNAAQDMMGDMDSGCPQQ